MIYLSEREISILQLISQGFDNKEIGKKLYISIHTVKVYITKLLIKFNAKNRTQIAYIIGKDNIIE